MEKNVLICLEGRSKGCEVRHALRHIHLLPFISLLCSPHLHLPHSHTVKMIHLQMYAGADEEEETTE